jgi:hypothetical protein
MLPPDIDAGADTVVNLARHFDRLKARVTELLELFRASERGYFTPSEDDEARHLLVSYWQSRNAVWEVIRTSQQQMESLPAEIRPAAFLVAYSGALALVDVARYLRNHFQNRPVVRQKLNEAEPAFGIPAGTYDRIQKSLTSPLHAWHLYHAVRFHQEHQADLSGLARQNPNLQPLWEIVRTLQPQVEVGIRRYARARALVRAAELATAVRRDLLGQALYGLQKGVSQFLSEKYSERGHSPALPGEVVASLREFLQPGDVLITRKEYALTNYFLPGFWPHAALFIGGSAELERLGVSDHANVAPRWHRLLTCDESEPLRVLEALKDGVRIRPLCCPLTCDSIAVLRPQIPESLIAQAIARGFHHEGKPYDFDFDFTRSDRLVCTEVVYRSFEGIGGIGFTLTRRAGRLTLAAEDLLTMGLANSHFRVVAAYSGHVQQALASGAAAVELVRATMSRNRDAPINDA